jgi:hypothetical protein
MKSTGALGIDGIPTLVLKLGGEVLASPIAHLVNMSLSSGLVPRDFKKALVVPIHKGGGKPHHDPASYRPVSLLTAMSKILETVVKSDLEEHFALVNAIPDSQWGFRPERSTTMALAAAHASWIGARKAGNAVGILAFDLSAAFDTISKKQLLPKLYELGIRGGPLRWFENYLTDGMQSVIWNNESSPFNPIEYGVRQGSILGPILYLALVSDMPKHIGEADCVSYADDTAIWASAPGLDEVKTALEKRAATFAEYAASCGLVLNASKTQLLVNKKKLPEDFHVMVNGSRVSPLSELELLGVRFDSDLTSRPQQKRLAAASRQRASCIARLTHHLPRGAYLRLLSHGLLMGKIGYATPVFVQPRLGHNAEPHPANLKSVQISINDVARSIVGLKRIDHVTVSDLLTQAGLPSLNKLTVKAMALEAWKAFHSRDGGDGARNMLGKAIFGGQTNDDSNRNRQTRSAADGKVVIPLRGENTYIRYAAEIWNMSRELREAGSVPEAAAVARKLALDAP